MSLLFLFQLITAYLLILLLSLSLLSFSPLLISSRLLACLVNADR